MAIDHVSKSTTKSGRGGINFFQHMNELSLFAAIIVLYVVFTSTANGFMSFNNQINILRDAATIGIAAWAATLIIIAGEIDVSVGPMVAFISVVLAYFLQWGVPTPLAFLLAIIVGGALGSIAGILRAYFDVPSFVGTLGLWSALRGTALFVTNALPVSIGRNDMLDRLDESVFGIPPAAIVMLVLFGVFAFISRKTAFGRSVFAIGGNPHAAFLSGINVSRIRVALFAIAGAMAAISGILLVSRLGSGNAGAATGLEFDVIAAVVVGGTSLSGGRGSMLGSLLGVLVITLIGNGLVLLGINPFFQQVVRGLIIVVAVLANIQAIKRSMSRNKAEPMTAIDLRNGDLSLRVSTNGGIVLGFWWHAGGEPVPLLRAAPGEDDEALSSGCYPLVPFGNRVKGNRFSFEGRDYALTANTDWDPHYLHGEGWTAEWSIATQSENEVRLVFIHEGGHTPYRYKASQHFALNGNKLEMQLAVTNIGEVALPFGLGWHPYFPLTPDTTLFAPAGKFWTEVEGWLPGEATDIPADLDFSTPAGLPHRWVNNGFENWSGEALISWPERRAALHLTADPIFRHAFIFVSDTAFDPGFHRDYFCFEPMSHLANGHNLPDLGDLKVLKPGETLSGAIRLRPKAI